MRGMSTRQATSTTTTRTTRIAALRIAAHSLENSLCIAQDSGEKLQQQGAEGPEPSSEQYLRDAGNAHALDRLSTREDFK